MFLNVVMLAGIAGAALPVVLHLLARARCQRVSWGAMMFLEATDAPRRRSTRLRHILLLLTRMAMVALLAVALARPVIASRAFFGTRAAEPAVILLDHSPSMAEPGRLEQARVAVNHILDTLGPDDLVSLILLGDNRGTADARGRIISQSTSIRRYLASDDFAVAGFDVADVTAGLGQAAQILAADPRGSGRLFLVCDDQAINWRGVDENFLAAWHSRWSAESGHRLPKFLVVPIGGPLANACAIESINSSAWPWVRGQASDIQLSIRNFGQTQAEATVQLKLDDQDIGPMHLTVGPNSWAAATRSIPIATTGSHVIRASIGRQTCPLCVDVIDPIDVLIIRDQTPAADYLRIALVPFASAGQAGVDPTTVQVRAYSPTDDWSDLQSQGHRVVILDDLASITDTQARSLHEYVFAGGGVLFSPGPHSNSNLLNAALWHGGQGILPARLGPAMTLPPSPIDEIDRSHPIFSFLPGKTQPDPALSIVRLFPALEIQQGSQVLARAGGNWPMLITAQRGRGRSALILSPLNQDWSSLPRTSFYLPMVQGIVKYLAEADDQNLTSAQPIILHLDAADAGKEAHITRPDGTQVALAMHGAGAATELRYTDTAMPGLYGVTAGKMIRYFAVRPTATQQQELDPTPLSRARWDSLAKALGFDVAQSALGPIGTEFADKGSGRELWLALVVCVMGLGVAEVFLGGVFSQLPRGKS